MTVTLNEMCLSSTVYTVSVLFGVTEESNDCEVKQNITASFVPGRGKTFTNTLILGPGQEYCFIITLADDASLPPGKYRPPHISTQNSLMLFSRYLGIHHVITGISITSCRYLNRGQWE